ncbi:MAG: glycosyltransferase family 2 protein [bacterium]
MISIIIVNYNMKELVSACLRSIFGDPPGAGCEVVLVDNNSADGSAEYLKEKFPDVNIIKNSENAGFARACNQGVRASGGDIVLFLNPDTEANGGALDHMASYLKENERAAIVGPKTVNTDGSIEPSVYYFPTPLRTFIDSLYLHKTFRGLNGYEHSDYESITAPRKVEVICGSCLMVKREALDAIGAFDEVMWMYGEDVDLCWRARKAGFDVLYLPGCSIVHKRGTRHLEEEAYHDIERLIYNHYRWIFYFARKHFSPLKRLMVHKLLALNIKMKLSSRKKKLGKGDDSKDNLARIRGLEKVLDEFV